MTKDPSMREMTPAPTPYPHDFEPYTQAIIDQVRPYTMTLPERAYTLIKAVEYIVLSGIPGDFVECGVWRGGSMMTIALTLKRMGATDRKLHLFDTYEGMPEPQDRDITLFGSPGREPWEQNKTDSNINHFCYASLEDVQTNMASTGYPLENIHYIQGRVQNTLPHHAPESIALLRLDTDWYDSCRHELQHLYPRLVSKGVLIADDYGYWQGQKDATDEYFRDHRIAMLLTRVDYCCRMGIKF